MPYSGASNHRPPPSTTMAVLGARLSAVTWVSTSAGGGWSSQKLSAWPSTAVQENHTPSTPRSTSSQASRRRLNIRRAPTSTRARKGTGGNRSVESTGFQCSRPRVRKMSFME